MSSSGGGDDAGGERPAAAEPAQKRARGERGGKFRKSRQLHNWGVYVPGRGASSSSNAPPLAEAAGPAPADEGGQSQA